MKTIFALATVLLAGIASAQNVTFVTETLTEFTTVCPAATTFAHGGSTYTATGPTTITLNCPCTVTRPVYTTTTVLCATCAAPTTSAAPIVSGAPIPSAGGSTAPYVNGTAGITPGSPVSGGAAPTGTAAATTSQLAIATGAAERMLAGSGAGLAAALGMAAYLL